MSDNTIKNKRLAKNTAFLYLRMFFVLFVTLYTSRVILRTLGIEDFGIYNVVSGFVSMFGFLNATLSASMQRFYNFELGKNGEEGVRKIYAIGFWIHVLIAVFLFVILETIGLWYINNVMVIPTDRLIAANVVYQSVVFSMMLIIMQIPYLGAILAYERMDYYAIVTILDVVLKLVIILILPYINKDKLIVYALLLSLISIINWVLYYAYTKRKILRLRVRTITLKETIDILSFSGWNLIGTFAFMIKDQGLNMLLNFFFGPVVNAARGIAFQVKNALTNFTQSISMAFRPQIVDAYSKNENERVSALFFFESKICFCLVLFLLIPLVMGINLILGLWLGDVVPDCSSIFTVLVLVDTLICSMNPCMGHVAHAVGRIKNYQLANSYVNILIIPTAWVFLHLGFSATSVFVVAIVFSILNQAVCLVELHKIYEFDMKAYFSTVILPCISIAIISFIPQFAIKLTISNKLTAFALNCLTDLVVTGGLVYLMILNKEEKKQVKKIVMQIIKK